MTNTKTIHSPSLFTFWTLFLMMCVGLLSAQPLDLELIKEMKPRNVGPGGMSGRVTAIDVVTSNPEVIYAGTASGGLWKSTSGGIKWEPIFEKEATASIGAVAVDQSNPSVIWVGTGEGNPRNSLNGGFGIYKSLDGGKNWILMGLEKTRHIHRVIVDPTDSNTVYAAAIGSPWGIHPERGVYKTTDGGKTWDLVLSTNSSSGAADLVMDPTNPNKLFAAMWEHKRDPWFFKSGGKGSGLFMTHDGGKNWKQLTDEDGLPKGELGRIGLAVAANKPNVVYALIEAKKNALYRSDDGGFKWAKINDNEDIGNRPFYYSDIFVDPENENRVYSVFTYVNVSEDGGKKFESLMPSYGVSNGVHPDHHAWWIHPNNGQYMIDGNDGGLNITRDGGKSWQFIGNLPVGQFYHVNVDNDVPYNIYGGMQDNGSWRGPAYVWRDQGIRNSYWQEISFGDGFDVVPDPKDSRYGWTMSQQGYVERYDWQTGNNYSVRPTHPDPNMDLRFNWNAAINIDPFDSSTLYFGSQFVHKSNDKGLTWSIISGDLTTNDPEKLKQGESGGLTMDATGAENHCTILVVEPSPTEKNMLWVGTDDGRVQVTMDGGANWEDVSKGLKDLPEGSWIAQIKASANNPGEALLVANDYRRFNFEPYVYRTTNYGKKWKRLVSSKDTQSFALSIVQDTKESNLLFLGTDDGLYVSIDAGENWVKWTNGFPTVPVNDMVIHPREDDLIITTFGRSHWVLDDIRPLRAMAANSKLTEQTIVVFDPPTAYLAAYQQPTGSRFGADDMFNGENRDGGGRLSYYVKVDTTSTDVDKKSSDSLHLKIYHGDKEIRHLKQSVPKKSGVYTWRWRLDEKGVDRPSRRSRSSRGESGGVTVLPGTYRMVLSKDSLEVETQMTVELDPRLDVDLDGLTEQYNMVKTLEQMQQTAADAVKQLSESLEIINKFNASMKDLDKEKFKDVLDQAKKESEKIEKIVALYIGKEDDRQGITRNPEVSIVSRMYSAQSYVVSRPSGLTSTEFQLVDQAKNALNEALKQTNSYFEKDWVEYQSTIKELDLSPFKEVNTFSIIE